jgi:hypothetical protein
MPDDTEITCDTVYTVDQLNPQDIRNYWDQVEEILKGSFKVSDEDTRAYVDDIQKRLQDTPADTQLYFYHANPFEVAADLAKKNTPITYPEKEFYVAHVRKRPENDRPSREVLQRLLPDDLIHRPKS